MAAITGAHGVAGEVRLKLFGDGIGALKGARSFNDGTLTPTAIRPDNKGGAIARFAEIADRTAAEALRGTVLTVPRDALPPLEEGEFYHADLIGLEVYDTGGVLLGRVKTVQNHGADDLLELQLAGTSATTFLPFTKAAVPTVDLASGRIIADPPLGVLPEGKDG